MAIPRFPDPKDPEDISDFTVDFSEAMSPGDVISAVSDVSISPSNALAVTDNGAPDISCVARLYSGQVATLWISGGKPGWRYEVGVLVSTAGGRTLRRRALLFVVPL